MRDGTDRSFARFGPTTYHTAAEYQQVVGPPLFVSSIGVEDHFRLMPGVQLEVFLLRRAARLLEQGKRSGAILGLIGVVLGPKPMLFTNVHPAVEWFWPVLLGAPLVMVWFQLAKRPTSIVDRVPEAP